MCTLAVFREVSAAYPLIVVANRDEFYARESAAPQLLDEDPAVAAGRDLEAGGTWLGARVRGPFFLSALLNRREAGSGEPSRRGQQSRGKLCLDVLCGAASVAAALALIDADGADTATAYGAFNLLLADSRRCVVVDNLGGVLNRTELEAGLSVLTNLEVNDGRCPRLANATQGFTAVAARLARGAELEDTVEAMRAVLADHVNRIDPEDDSPFSRICVHAGQFGTRSSSLLAVSGEGRVRYFHCEGPPCRERLLELAL